MFFESSLNQRKIALTLFIASIVFGALQDFPLSVWAVANGLPTQPQKIIGFQAVVSFYWLKTIKYFLFLLALIFLFFSLTKNGYQRMGASRFLGRLYCNRWLMIYFAFVGVAIFPSMVIGIRDGSFGMFLAGCKTWAPWLAILIGFLLNEKSWRIIAAWVDSILVLNLCFALVQWWSWLSDCQSYGEGCGDFLFYRLTGTFVEPYAMAAFAMARIVLMLLGISKSPRILILCFLLIAISGHRSVMIAFAIPFFYLLKTEFEGRYQYAWRVKIIAFGCLIVVGWGLSRRGWNSVLERVDFIRNYANIGDLMWGSGWGAGTVSSYTYSHVFPSVPMLHFTADSLYASLLIQGGVWMLFFICLGMIGGFFLTGGRYIFTSIVLMGVGANIFEVWPFNIIFFAAFGYLLKINRPPFRNGNF